MQPDDLVQAKLACDECGNPMMYSLSTGVYVCTSPFIHLHGRGGVVVPTEEPIGDTNEAC